MFTQSPQKIISMILARTIKCCLLPFAFCLVFSSCRKADIIDEKTFTDCYAQILVIKTATADSTASNRRVQDFLATKNISKEQMQQQLALYTEDPARYRKILDGINAKLRSMDSLSKIQK